MNEDSRDQFFELVENHALSDKNVVFLTNDMDLFSLKHFKTRYPERFINVGVSEQNLMNLAAGLAESGKKVIVFGILSFLTTRCFEQIKLNICGMKLPVIIAGIGPGLAFSFDGSSHHGIQDIGLMRTLPELLILNPSDPYSSKKCAEIALEFKSPIYVRVDKGVHSSGLFSSNEDIGGLIIKEKVQTINIIYTGTVENYANTIFQKLRKINKQAGVINLYQIKPLPQSLKLLLHDSTEIIIVEENSRNSGIYSIVSQFIIDNALNVKVTAFTIDDLQIKEYGERHWLQEKYGLGQIYEYNFH